MDLLSNLYIVYVVLRTHPKKRDKILFSFASSYMLYFKHKKFAIIKMFTKIAIAICIINVNINRAKNYITNSNLTTTFASYNEQASQSMYPRSTTSSNVPPIDIIPPQSLVSSNKLFLTQVCTLYCSQ